MSQQHARHNLRGQSKPSQDRVEPYLVSWALCLPFKDGQKKSSSFGRLVEHLEHRSVCYPFETDSSLMREHLGIVRRKRGLA